MVLGSGQANEDRKLCEVSSLKESGGHEGSADGHARWSSPADGGINGAQPLQDAVRVTGLEVRGQEGGVGQIRECATADSRSVLAPIVAGQESLQRGPAPYPNEKEGFERKASR